jgi:hypothetical protein
MGGRHYDEAQRDVLNRLAEAHEAEQVAKATLKRRIEEAFQEQLAGLRYEKSLLMNEALRTVNARGVAVAKADIHRTVKEGNWEKLKALYALAENDPRLGSGTAPKKPQTFDYRHFKLVTVPGSPTRQPGALLHRLWDWKRLDLELFVEDDGFLTVEGALDYALKQCLYGTPGILPGTDVQPDAEVVGSWNEIVAILAREFGNPAIEHNALPLAIQFDEQTGAALTPRALFEKSLAESEQTD